MGNNYIKKMIYFSESFLAFMCQLFYKFMLFFKSELEELF